MKGRHKNLLTKKDKHVLAEWFIVIYNYNSARQEKLSCQYSMNIWPNNKNFYFIPSCQKVTIDFHLFSKRSLSYFSVIYSFLLSFYLLIHKVRFKLLRFFKFHTVFTNISCLRLVFLKISLYVLCILNQNLSYNQLY